MQTDPALTLGMATHDDFHGVYFTVQSLRLHHPDVGRRTEIVVVDNNPDGEHGQQVRQFLGWVKGDVRAVKYVPAADVQGTAAPRDRVFAEASSDYVAVVDCHVLFPPGSLAALLAHYAAHPDTRDLLSGPMLYDDLVNRATHFADEWRGEMWGTWATDPRGDPLARDEAGNALCTGQPFEIPAMGLGFFSCRKDAWPGFNRDFRGFGGEEFYVHEKFRRGGARCLCLPAATWLHRFGRPGGARYAMSRWDKVRNYVIGHRELGLSLDRVHEHFVASGLFSSAEWDAVLAGAVSPPQPPRAAAAPAGSCQSCASGGQPGARASRSLPPEGASLDELFAWVKATPRDLDLHADYVRQVAAQARRVVAFVKRREWNVLLAAARPAESLTVYQTEADPLLDAVHQAVKQDGGTGSYSTVVGPGADSLAAQPARPADLLVIDTVHSAERLWAELVRHGDQAGRILLRGTGAFGEQAEGGQAAGLRHAVRRWVRERPEWTVAYSSSEQYGMMLLSRLDADKKSLPSLWQQGVNALKASVRAGQPVVGYGPLKDAEAQDRRLALCLLCPAHNGGRCAECGCPVDKKTSYPTEACPLGHWGAQDA